MFILPSLNQEQQRAVLTTDGAVLVVAGAGTGKTKVLTTRIANIILSNLASADEILAVTFTNKSAAEMMQRVVNLLKHNGYRTDNFHNLWIGTFHSLALRIIRPLYKDFGRSENFNVIKTSEQMKIIKQIMQSKKISDTMYNPKDILSAIAGRKEAFLTERQEKNEVESIMSQLIEDYENELERLNVIDFSDILKNSVEIFKRDPHILAYYQQKFKYIMVDEYQDTNVLQYTWLKLLSDVHKNICCVGDDDQSIYAWRGADIRNILKFNEDYQNAKLIKLEQNYRSVGNILEGANAVITNNKMRIGKILRTDTEAGLPIMITRASDPIDEAQIIVNIIKIKLKHGCNYNDFAILARTSAQTRVFEEEFMTWNIPYILSDGVRFYDRMEIKDIIAYLKLLINPNDEISLKRVTSVPKRGIGNVTLASLYSLATEKNLTLDDAAMASGNKRLIGFFEQLSQWRILMHRISPQKLVATILTQSGYMNMIRSMPENDEKLIMINNLMDILKSYNSVRDFLDYVSLANDNPISEKNRVNISTIHAAKGLEYRVVFIPGLEEGILPHSKSIKEKEGIEEERRLFYVALTRARKEVFITMCDNRPIYGTSEYMGKSVFNTQISRFVMELPRNCIRWF